MKNVDSVTVVFDKTEGITVISNLTRSPRRYNTQTIKHKLRMHKTGPSMFRSLSAHIKHIKIYQNVPKKESLQGICHGRKKRYSTLNKNSTLPS